MTNEITIGRFNEMNIDEKSYYLWHGATFLHVYEKSGYRVNLFFMNDYYIELHYNIETNKIDRIRAFTSVHCLEPFLDNIRIEVLLN
jgi:hypothetical protein